MKWPAEPPRAAEVPLEDRPVEAARVEGLTVCTEGDAERTVLVAGERLHHIRRLRVPDCDLSVLVGRHDHIPPGREGDSLNRDTGLPRSDDGLVRLRVHERDRAVQCRERDRPAVGRKRRQRVE